VPPEEYDGMISATAAIHAVANVTVATCSIDFGNCTVCCCDGR